MATCLVALGSNLGDRSETIDRAVAAMKGTSGIRVVAESTRHVTRSATGSVGQSEYVNAAVRCETALQPAEVLQMLLAIESQHGRQRTSRWSARTIDLDLLLYDQQITSTQFLVLPHPRMTFRRFVLEPALEIAADLVHPVTGWTLAEHLDWLDTQLDEIALAGSSAEFRRNIAVRSAAILGCRLADHPATDAGRAKESKEEPLVEFGTPAAGSFSSFTICENWLNDAAAETSVVGSRLFVDAGVSGANRIPTPKLLIYFQHPPNASSESALHRQQHLIPYRFPLLILHTTDFDEAVDEVVAAGQAMNTD